MKKNKKNNSAPILCIRPMLVWIVMIVLMISGPLLLVWKQVYINTTSLQMDSMKKTLIVLNKEINTLKMSCNRLSSADRIEGIAHNKLGMDYPTTSQIYVVNVPSKNKTSIFPKSQDVIAFLRKMITGEQG